MWTQQKLIDELLERGRFDAPVLIQVTDGEETYTLPLERVGVGPGEVSLFVTLFQDRVLVENTNLPISADLAAKFNSEPPAPNPGKPGKDEDHAR